MQPMQPMLGWMDMGQWGSVIAAYCNYQRCREVQPSILEAEYLQVLVYVP
jgi:hypothetical protein